MKIIFARHGESQANILHVISNSGLKHPLTQKGREQAAALAEKLQSHCITHIYSSPVLRAIETSVIVANQLGVEYEVNEALREYSMGNLEGRSDDAAWKDWKDLFDAWSKHQRYDQKVEGGETFHNVRNRFVPFIESFIEKYKNTDSTLLCVAHGGLYWMMLPIILKNIDTTFIHQQNGIHYTDYAISLLTQGGLTCVEWNGTPVES
jgi:broad specificity phosphatase PhoE